MKLESHLRLTGRDELVGRSEAMVKMRRFCVLAGQCNANVLITGESGTGKELVAKMIHRVWNRRQNRKEGAESIRPFVVVNCGAIPNELVESELFGHERGAFTSAVATKHGKFEVADGGSIFLDEIGELPLSAQVKVLRVLQERTFFKVGSVREQEVTVRIIAAANRNLLQAMRNGQFREDLYYRINVLPIEAVPLRHRLSDVPCLVMHFFEMRNSQCEAGGEAQVQMPIEAEVLDLLSEKSWPGNVRQLFNVLERAAIFARTTHSPDRSRVKILAVRDFDFLNDPSQGLCPSVTSPVIGSEITMQVLADMHTLAVYEKTGRNKTQTAKILGLSVRTVRTTLKRLVQDEEI